MTTNHKEEKTAKKNISWKKLFTYAGICIAFIVMSILSLFLIYGDAVMNDYGKRALERRFAALQPGNVLQIGELNCSIRSNSILARNISLSTIGATFESDQISISGIHWARLLLGKFGLVSLLVKTNIESTNIDIKFPEINYGIRCARFHARGPAKDLMAEGVEVFPLITDKELFMIEPFRTTRFHVFVASFTISGLQFADMLKGKSYRAKLIQFFEPSFDAFVNRDKAVGPFVKSPLMVHEALALVPQLLEIDNLIISNGLLKYSERVVYGAKPGIVTFTDVNMDIKHISNRGNISPDILVNAQGKLMNAGLLKVVMTIPVAPQDFSLYYYGSLGAMDLTRLNAFLVIAEHIRIKSGTVKEITYKIDVSSGQAIGNIIAVYNDLSMALLDRKFGTENSFSSFLANTFTIWSTSDRLASGIIKPGKVKYTKLRDEGFVQFVWYALRSGVLDTINR